LQNGTLKNAVTYRLTSAVGPEFDATEAPDGDDMSGAGNTATAAPDGASERDYRYAAVINMTYGELYAFRKASVRPASVHTFDLTEPTVITRLSVADYTYDTTTGLFVTELTVTSGVPLEQGLPITVVFDDSQQLMGGDLLIPIGGVYREGNGQYYVYLITDTKTLWGVGKTVSRVDVEYFGSDYANASVSFEAIGKAEVACNPTKPLYDGASVRVAS
jgi:hypothetical protein